MLWNTNLKETESEDSEKRKLRLTTYWLYTLIIVLILGFISIYWYEKRPTLFSVLLGGSIALFIASIIQLIQNKTIVKTLSEDVSNNVTREVSKKIDKIEKAEHRIFPKKVYRSDEEEFDKEIDACLEKSKLFRFMSISGWYLLNERLEKINFKNPIHIHLLLQNPTDKANLSLRSEQMKEHGEKDKGVKKLQEEIIRCIQKAYTLKEDNRQLNFQIRFHEGVPLCRLEFSGENDLFVSFYESQEGKENFGPVAHYKRESDIYRSFYRLFEDMWKQYEDTEINLTHYSSSDSLAADLREKFREIGDSI